MPMTLTIVASLLFTFTPAADDRPKVENLTYRGKVVTMAEALKAKGIEFDPEPVAGQAGLVTPKGEVVALLSDEASRALFLDKRLRDRDAELIGRKVDGTPYFRVVAVRVVEGGVLRTPEYYCEICAISVRYPQICPCCQGDMILQYRPEGR